MSCTSNGISTRNSSPETELLYLVVELYGVKSSVCTSGWRASFLERWGVVYSNSQLSPSSNLQYLKLTSVASSLSVPFYFFFSFSVLIFSF